MVQFIIEVSYFSRAGGECHRVGQLLELLQSDIDKIETEGQSLNSVQVMRKKEKSLTLTLTLTLTLIQVVRDDEEVKSPLLISRVADADMQAHFKVN